jgi:hypothetical protein
VVNIPNVIWIDEDGLIVRPPEPGWAAPVKHPQWLSSRLEEQVRKALEDAAAEGREPVDPRRTMDGGQDRDAYADAVRDWAHHGPASRFAMTPEQVIDASQPRDPDRSEAAARFDLGRHLWETVTAPWRSSSGSVATSYSPTTGPTSARPGHSSATSRSAAAKPAASTKGRSPAARTSGHSRAAFATTSRR